MAIGDVYRIINSYTWAAPVDGGNDEECQNVYHYAHTSGADVVAADNLLAAFLGSVANAIINLAPPHITFTGTVCYKLEDQSDFAQFIGNAPGLRVTAVAVQSTPEQNIVLYHPRPFPGTRQARKSYPFLMRNEVNGKNIDYDINDLQTPVTALRALLGQSINSSGQQFTPCVPLENPTGVWTARWFPTTWQQKTFVGSQDTRRK